MGLVQLPVPVLLMSATTPAISVGSGALASMNCKNGISPSLDTFGLVREAVILGRLRLPLVVDDAAGPFAVGGVREDREGPFP